MSVVPFSGPAYYALRIFIDGIETHPTFTNKEECIQYIAQRPTPTSPVDQKDPTRATEAVEANEVLLETPNEETIKVADEVVVDTAEELVENQNHVDEVIDEFCSNAEYSKAFQP